MGITAERVAAKWKVQREAQDAFALESHRRAVAALDAAEFEDEVLPYNVVVKSPDLERLQVVDEHFVVDTDEGPRSDTSIEVLSKLRPAFAAGGTVSAGNSSQMSDGAGAVLLASDRALKTYELAPMARFMGYSVAGVAPELMGIGPVAAVPAVLKNTGIRAGRA